MSTFEKELQNLQNLILKYEQLSKDTLMSKPLKETIAKHLAKKSGDLDDTNCTTLYDKFVKHHSNGAAALAFPYFTKITDEYPDAVVRAALDPSLNDYFTLREVLKASNAIKLRPCYDSLTRIGMFQFNYVTERQQYLGEQRAILKSKVDKKVLNVHIYLRKIQEEYDTLPAIAQNVLTDKDYKETLILSEQKVLLAISATYEERKIMLKGSETNTYAPIVALGLKDYTAALKEVKGSAHFGPYKKAYETFKFFSDNRKLINDLKGKAPAPEDVSLKTYSLNVMVRAINAQTDLVEEKERDDDYPTAKKEATELKKLWTDFVAKYKEENYASVLEATVKNTRFEKAYQAVNTAYDKSTVTIQTLTENINTNYPSLDAVVQYKALYRLTWKNFNGAYLIGNPTKENEKNITDLIVKLDLVRKEFDKNPNLKNISSLRAKDLTVERKKWAERLLEVESILTQKEIWKKNVVEAPEFQELKGLTLKPQEFTDEDYDPVKAKHGKIAIKGKKDSKDVDPNDVNQGNLGDCYFLASVASMATTPNFFYGNKDSVITIVHPDIKKAKKGQKVGDIDMKKIQYFSVRMYLPLDAKDGSRTPVNVLVYPSKDLIGSSQLKYAQKADSGELWVAIVERAFAEIRGGYDQLNGGFAEEGYALLMNKTTEDFNRINLDDKAKIRKLKLEYGDESLSKEAVVVKKLTEAIKTSKISIGTPSKLELLAAGAEDVVGESLNGDHQVYVYNKAHKAGDKPDLVLYETHSYSVESMAGDKFKIRNPHGNPTTGHTYEQEIFFELTGKQIVQFFSSIVIVK